MQRSRWIALQGSSRGSLPPLLLVCFITTSGIPAHAADVSAACSSPVARVVSIQGSIEVLRARQNDWSRVTRLDTPLCEGDRLRTGVRSRAALFIQPETLVRVDQNTSITVNQTGQETLVEFTQAEVLPAAASAYSCGAGYFITRFPRKFRVKTPHLNAAVEGTEFLVAMRCERTELSVFEGKVLAASTGADVFPSQSISSGQMLTIGGSEPPTVKLLVKPTDAVQWVVYYPPLSDAIAEPDLPTAEQCRSLPKRLDQTCLSQRAEVLLRLGRVDEAQREVDEAVALDPGSGDTNALRAIISIARNDKAAAIAAATAATTASPNSSRAWLALSYAQQASFKLEDSLASARKAQSLEPNRSVTNARVAELLMSLGRIKAAEVAARSAADSNPLESRAHTILGFVHLAQIKTKEARADFLAAIERDSSDPLPRLGLGLAIIRDGKLAEGREQLEIAVALDPTNSLLRSYVGKAYYEENTKERDQLAETQFNLAKQLDPNDPTPHFYDAILKQTQNRPVEALEELRASVEKNDNRAVYRSRLLLEQDRSSRGVSLAQTYADLGFESLAVTEAARSLSFDPANYSGHRLLSDIYTTKERHDIARVSELLQSQLLQPVNINPVQPHATFVDLATPFLAAGASPGFNEDSPLFERNRARLSVAGLAGSNDTVADELVLSGVKDRVSYSVGQFHFESDGFRENDDQLHNIYDVFAQVAATPAVSVQAEFRHRETEQGDLILRGDPALFDPLFRQNLNEDVGRLGARVSTSTGFVVIASVFSFETNLERIFVPDPLAAEYREERGNQGELRADLAREKFSLTTGLGAYRSDVHQFDNFGTDFTFTRERQNVYGYLNIWAPSRLLWTLGASYDSNKREGAFTDQDGRWNAKLGLQWQVSEAIRLRGAVFDTLKSALFTQQTIEPTNVAGFNQFYDDLNGTRASNQAIGFDVELKSSTHISGEYQNRDLEVPLSVVGLGTVLTAQEREQLASLSLTQTFGTNWAVKVQWNSARFESDGLISLFTLLETQTVPISLRYFTPFGLKVEARATQVRQTVDNSVFASPGTQLSEFVLYDLLLTCRLPRRYGTISLEGRNLTNESFFYMDLNTRNPTISSPAFVPETQVFLRLNLQLQ
ncbi:MAG TPA: FecR domain-containing protein [Burkholderiales bacterium]|nr:FecR domain-containing protein [Burkholderiales bacterium]